MQAEADENAGSNRSLCFNLDQSSYSFSPSRENEERDFAFTFLDLKKGGNFDEQRDKFISK